MQVLSRVSKPFAYCWRPAEPSRGRPVDIETTQTPTGPGACMHPRDVQVSAPKLNVGEAPLGTFGRLPWAWEAHTCVINNFVWKDPKAASAKEIQAYYVKRIGKQGTFGGYLEAEALGHLLGIRIGLWDKFHGYYRWLATLGVDASEAPCVHMVNLAGVHWCALIAPSRVGAMWTQRDAGGQGDCLFHAVHAAIAAHPSLPAPASAQQLRRACAEELAKPAYGERISRMSEQAWDEWRSASRWRRLRLRFS